MMAKETGLFCSVKRELLAYLKGEREQPPQTVDLLAPIPAPIPISRLIDQNEPDTKKARYDGEGNRQRIQNLLKGAVTGSTKSAETEGVRDLSDKLTADKIAALKNKRKKNMARNTIKSVDDRLGNHMDFDVPEVTADALDRELKSKERVWRNRTTIMEAASKEFTPILSILHSFRLRDEAAQRQKSAVPPSRTAVGDRGKTQPIGYSRYDQERFNKDQTAGFNIETGLTFQGTSIMSVSGAKPMVAIEPSAPTRAMVLGADNTAPRYQKRQSRTPIIIIPAAGTSLITMFNVRDILQDMRFVATEERKATCRRESEILIQRLKQDGVTVPYRIVDNPFKFGDDEWSRVVAGPAWQFKGWRWNGSPTDIFANVSAFHLMFDDQKVDDNIAKWSVSILKLSRTKRHLDRAILARFWEALDRYIIKNKPHLRF
ncbi:unnamed protein product [Gongylonema pulchrum]|uniref:Parafibromin n=1 Tax=Gongylonema pulchrum TaxID=637853 RepID=A0A183EA77_9BILA|nr:unnamed protein product [Gongylonema pulchrum]